jgi:hypothetical protein
MPSGRTRTNRHSQRGTYGRIFRPEAQAKGRVRGPCARCREGRRQRDVPERAAVDLLRKIYLYARPETRHAASGHCRLCTRGLAIKLVLCESWCHASGIYLNAWKKHGHEQMVGIVNEETHGTDEDLKVRGGEREGLNHVIAHCFAHVMQNGCATGCVTRGQCTKNKCTHYQAFTP